MPEDFSQVDGFGLNKSERLKNERDELIASQQPAPLEPSFPFRVEPFDPLFFGARAEHPAETPAV